MCACGCFIFYFFKRCCCSSGMLDFWESGLLGLGFVGVLV